MFQVQGECVSRALGAIPGGARSQAGSLSVQDYFPHRFCVNLDRRADRWATVQDQFRQVGLDPVQRFSAFDAQTLAVPGHWSYWPGAYGCLASHLEIVRQAKAKGFDHVLILEDDVVFAADLEARLPRIMAALPDDWDMFSFGGSHEQAPSPVAPEIFRMSETFSTHAYVLRHTIFDAFIELNSRGLAPVDVNNAKLQKRFNGYVSIPHLAWQVDGWSDIQQDEESNWAIRESLVQFGPHVDRLLENTALIIAYRQQGDADLCRQNLEYVLNFYHESLPAIEKLVVACGDELGAGALPAYCRLIPCERPEREAMFREGRLHAQQRSYFIFSDAAVTPSRIRNVRANLLMCERHGGSTFFDTLVELNAADSELVRSDRKLEVCLTRYAPEPVAAAEVGAFMISDERLRQGEGQPITALAGSGLFRPQNRGLRLSSTRG